MEDWVRAWLDEQRRQGEKCLEITYIQDKPYVYRSTSIYDKATKSPKKVSTYLAASPRKKGSSPKGHGVPAFPFLPEISESTGMLLSSQKNSGICFPFFRMLSPGMLAGPHRAHLHPDHRVYALSRVGDAWEKLDNILDISPDCDPRTLSRVLTAVGGDRAAQQVVFEHLSSPARRLIYDLSFVFSYSETINLAEFGYNAEGVWLPQVNIALFSAADTRLPVMIRATPGFRQRCCHAGRVATGDRYHRRHPHP